MLDKTKVSLEPATKDAEYFEYTKAANPVGTGVISLVPYHSFPPSLYKQDKTQVIPLDLSKELMSSTPATGPGLLAHFIRILSGDRLSLQALTTSQIFYVIRGTGEAAQGKHNFSFAEGAFFAMPGGDEITLTATSDTVLYYVNDAPLLSYLGVTATHPRFQPTLYPAEKAEEELQKAANDEDAGTRSRVSILLSNTNFPQTRTVTHVLWAMYGLLPPGTEQKAHRHQSVALDYIVDAPEGCYTLVGESVDDYGKIINPIRIDWESGMAFVTPPGFWHAHFNESTTPAKLIPVQDAGLQTWLRSLDIRFT